MDMGPVLPSRGPGHGRTDAQLPYTLARWRACCPRRWAVMNTARARVQGLVSRANAGLQWRVDQALSAVRSRAPGSSARLAEANSQGVSPAPTPSPDERAGGERDADAGGCAFCPRGTPRRAAGGRVATQAFRRLVKVVPGARPARVTRRRSTFCSVRVVAGRIAPRRDEGKRKPPRVPTRAQAASAVRQGAGMGVASLLARTLTYSRLCGR
jgi:hypothetical protein